MMRLEGRCRGGPVYGIQDAQVRSGMIRYGAWYDMVWSGRYGMALLQLEGTCMLQSVVGSWLPFEKFLVVPVCCVGVEGTMTSPLEAESDLPRLRRASLSR